MAQHTMQVNEYPLFDSIAKHVTNGLKGNPVNRIKRWHNEMLNATGLEIRADLGFAGPIKSVTINFDWDRFKEFGLAKQLKMQEHPLIIQENKESAPLKNVLPSIEIEVAWHISPPISGHVNDDRLGDERLKQASIWMQQISHDVNTLLVVDKVISRWHIDIEGDMHGKFISDAMLMAYFNYDLSELRSIEQVDKFVKKRLNYLIYKTGKVIKIARNVLKEAAA